MSFTSIGDLTRTFAFRQQNAQLKQSITQYSQELASGRTTDLAKHLKGNFGALTEFEGRLTSLASYDVAITEVKLLSDTMQTSLDTVETMARDLASPLLMAGNAINGSTLDATTADAHEKFEAAISSINTRSGSRSAFSGTAVNQTSLASARVILDDLGVALAGATTAADAMTVIDAWFDTGGGYDTVAYTGGANSLDPQIIGEGKSVELTVTANDPAIRDTLKGFAVGALLHEGLLSGLTDERATLARYGGETLMSSEGTLANLRAGIGSVQGHIEDAGARLANERTSLEIARNALIDIDPYETASALTEAQTQLELLYAATGRIASLSLVNFIR